MKRIITLDLGPGGAHLSQRVLVVRQLSDSASPTIISTQTLGGTAETADVACDENSVFEATLTDRAAGGSGSGQDGWPTVIKFSTHTGGSGERFQSGALGVLSWDEESESSQSSLSSLSSSSSSNTVSSNSSSSSSLAA